MNKIKNTILAIHQNKTKKKEFKSERLASQLNYKDKDSNNISNAS